MTLGKTLTAALGAALALAGCRGAPAEQAASDLGVLAFPVVVIHDATSITVHQTLDDLRVMAVQRVISRRDDPILIDSKFEAFVLAGLRSTKSGASLMLSGGTGSTPVAFDLVRRPELSGLQAARRLLLDTRYVAADPDLEESCRRAIAQETMMSGIIAALTREQDR